MAPKLRGGLFPNVTSLDSVIPDIIGENQDSPRPPQPESYDSESHDQDDWIQSFCGHQSSRKHRNTSSPVPALRGQSRNQRSRLFKKAEQNCESKNQRFDQWTADPRDLEEEPRIFSRLNSHFQEQQIWNESSIGAETHDINRKMQNLSLREIKKVEIKEKKSRKVPRRADVQIEQYSYEKVSIRKESEMVPEIAEEDIEVPQPRKLKWMDHYERAEKIPKRQSIQDRLYQWMATDDRSVDLKKAAKLEKEELQRRWGDLMSRQIKSFNILATQEDCDQELMKLE